MRFELLFAAIFGFAVIAAPGCGGPSQSPEEVDAEREAFDQQIFDDPASGPGSDAASADQAAP